MNLIRKGESPGREYPASPGTGNAHPGREEISPASGQPIMQRRKRGEFNWRREVSSDKEPEYLYGGNLILKNLISSESIMENKRSRRIGGRGEISQYEEKEVVASTKTEKNGESAAPPFTGGEKAEN